MKTFLFAWLAYFVVVVFFSVTIVWFVTPAGAQDAPLQCGDTDVLVPVLANLVALLQTPDENLVAALIETQVALAQFQAECVGLVFSGDGQQVIGPVTFPDGFYRARIEIEPGDFAIGIAEIQQIDGDCDFAFLLTGDNYIGESAYEFTGCVGLIDINTDGDWTLNFELLAAR